MYILGYVLYVLLCILIAWFSSRALTTRTGSRRHIWLALVLILVLLVAPMVDEVVGYFQFERLCREASQLKIHSTVQAGEDLYTRDGNWRMAMRNENSVALRKILNTYIREVDAPPSVVAAAIPIHRYEHRLYDAKTGAVLAEWQQYATEGGWLSQIFAGSGRKLLVRQQCMPEVARQGHALYTAIFEFKREDKRVR